MRDRYGGGYGLADRWARDLAGFATVSSITIVVQNPTTQAGRAGCSESCSLQQDPLASSTARAHDCQPSWRPEATARRACCRQMTDAGLPLKARLMDAPKLAVDSLATVCRSNAIPAFCTGSYRAFLDKHRSWQSQSNSELLPDRWPVRMSAWTDWRGASQASRTAVRATPRAVV